MNDNNLPGTVKRIMAVWNRHRSCYVKQLLANGLPPFMEPLFFILALGSGLGKHITELDGLSFAEFLAPAMMATSSFYTASFETTYAAFLRMDHQHTYHNILASPVRFKELYIAEILWCATKGFFFSSAVLLVIACFGLVSSWLALLCPFAGAVNAAVYASMGLSVTSVTRNINNYNLYFTGILTPMFFFSGTFFPLADLPDILQLPALVIPLTHSVKIMRALCTGRISLMLLVSFLSLFIIALPFILFSYKKLKKRITF